MTQKPVACVVIGVVYDDSMDAPLVLLREDINETVLSIPVGAFEAGAIIMAAEGLLPAQPQTHDFIAQFIKRNNFRMYHLELRGNPVSGYFGTLVYKRSFLKHRMEISPSDGIALAMRLGIPIMADQNMIGVKQHIEKESDFSYKEDHILFLDPQIHSSLR